MLALYLDLRVVMVGVVLVACGRFVLGLCFGIALCVLGFR